MDSESSAIIDASYDEIDIRTIHQNLINFLHSGRYSEASRFVESLADVQATEAPTAILTAHIWWQQGDFIRARKVIRAVDLESVKNDEKTAITLLDASFGTMLDFKVKSSLEIANSLRSNDNIITEISLENDITRCEALSLMYYHRIRLTAALCGFDRSFEAMEDAWEELRPLVLYFRHKQRFDEELFLVKWVAARLVNLPAQGRVGMLEDIVARISSSGRPEPAATHMIAHAHFAAGSFLLKTRKMEHLARAPLEKAVMKYSASNHAHGASEVAMLLSTDASHLLSIADIFDRALFHSGEVDALERAANFVNEGGVVPESQPDFLARTERKCVDYGMNLTLFLTYSSQVRRACQKDVGIGASMSFWETYMSKVDLFELGPVMGDNVAHSMMTAYRAVKDAKKELKWAKILYTVANRSLNYEDRSKAVVDYAISLSSYSTESRPKDVLGKYMDLRKPVEIDDNTSSEEKQEGATEKETRSELTQAIELLESWIMMDYMIGILNGVGAQEKTYLLITCYLSRWKLEGRTRGGGDLQAAEGLIENFTKSWGEDDRIEDCKIDLLRMSGKTDEAIALARLRVESIGDDLDCIVDVAEINKAVGSFEQLATCLQEKVLYELLPGGGAELEEIAAVTNKALKILRGGDASEASFRIVSLRIWALEVLAKLSDDDKKVIRLLEDLVATIEAEMKRTAALRDNVDILDHGSPSVFSKAALADLYSDDILLHIGIRALLELGEEEIAWRWVQLGKARCLMEHMGGRASLLGRFEDTVKDNGNHDKELQALLQEESRLKVIAEQAKTGERVPALAALEEIRTKLRENPSMAKLTTLSPQAGGSETPDFTEAENNILYADWYILRKGPRPEKLKRGDDWNYPMDDSPFMLFLRKGSQCIVRRLEATNGEVNAWFEENLQFPTNGESKLAGRSGNEILAQLSDLLEGITGVAQPEELIVICPTDSLHGIPLHAIPLENEHPLIDSNPIVYTSSVQNFRQCCLRAESSSKLACEATPQFISVYEEPESLAERDAVLEAIGACSEKIGGTLLNGATVTSDKFRSIAESSNWIHYHGRAKLDPVSPLATCLVLSNAIDPQVELADKMGSQAEPTLFSVLDMFSLSPKYSPTFVITPCESREWNTSRGGDTLSIVTGLLLSGASSVLGTQWPVRSFVGRMFSAALYENIKAQRDVLELADAAEKVDLVDAEDKGQTRNVDGVRGERKNAETIERKVVDVAMACRAAVRRIRANKETSAPYHWAGFVVHGSPQAHL